eukprot:CAMPEP_0184643920 /NCGR_PEP_ID=MMETSP0308-20130426/730_1 /TAXON_ID=38269 /ORGANISM="Gloeochaete witrockiana, Strain SAG 46.84" /LENGTH=106 /DNA_ID=CAMNT_0027072177 /DNA_START=254 /DNA_END=574 /DNA_ORIENTATION=+
MATPEYDDEGQLSAGGTDLSGKGLCEYYFDLIYITMFVQAGAAFSDYFWFVYFIIPAFAAYKLYDTILKPWFFSIPEDDEDDPKKRKKKERQEKRASQPRYKMMRR